jgi:hypothetical protein
MALDYHSASFVTIHKVKKVGGIKGWGSINKDENEVENKKEYHGNNVLPPRLYIEGGKG